MSGRCVPHALACEPPVGGPGIAARASDVPRGPAGSCALSPRTPPLEAVYARYLAGDSAALQELVVRLSPELRRLVRRLGASAEQSDDAVQELWLAVLRSGERFDAQRPLLPWLHAVLRFRWRSFLRREQRLAAVHEAARAERGAELQDEGVASAEALAIVQRALQSLPTRYRAALELHLIEGLSPAEVAQRLRLPRSSVRVLLHRGRRQLRQALPRGMSAALLIALLRRRARAASTWGVVAAAAALFVAVALWTRGPSETSHALLADAPPPTISTESVARAALEPAPRGESTERTAVAASDTLAVEVVRADGTALRAVGVTLEPLDGSDPRLHREFALTDEHGRATLPRRNGVPLRLSTDRLAAVELDEQQTTARLVVSGGLAVRGRVVDERGTPIADARVWLGDLHDSRRGQVVAASAADGAFELEHVPANASVAAFAPGHRRSAMTRLQRGGDGAAAEVVLALVRGGAELRVRVVDAGAAPVRAARLFAGRSVDGVPPELAEGLLPAFPPTLEARTDERGFAQLDGLEPGRHNLVVRSPDFAPACVQVDVEDGQALEVELRVSSGATLTGRVVDSAGRAVPRAQLAWRGADPLASTYLTTDDDGRFRAEGLPAGWGSLAARAFDHSAAERRARTAPGVETPVELVLAPLPVCRGTLRDDLGQPLAGFELRVLGAPNSAFAPDSDDDVTDASGAFSFALPGGQLRRLEARGPGWPQWLAFKRAWLRQVNDELELLLPRDALPTAHVRGALRYWDGAPARNRRLDLLVHSGGGAAACVTNVASTTSEGELALGPLPPGRYTLLLARGEHGESADAPLGAACDFELEDGAQLDLSRTLPVASDVEFDLRFASGARPAAPITSLVVGADGARLALWRVAGGRVRLLPGRYSLHAMGEDFVWTQTDVLAPSTSSTERWSPVLQRAFATRIALAALPEHVDAGAGITLQRAQDGATVGRFSLEPEGDQPQLLQSFLAPGDYVASVRGQDGRMQRAPLRVEAVEAACVELRFER
jgi:RNA polymerase sigma-70 factor (ECF subfamily)